MLKLVIILGIRNRRMRNRMYDGVRGRKTKVGRKRFRFPPTRLYLNYSIEIREIIFSARVRDRGGFLFPAGAGARRGPRVSGVTHGARA